MSTTSEERKLTLADIRSGDKTLFVKNNGPTIITCSPPGGQDFVLTPQGTEDSIKILPKEVALVPQFQKLWIKKQITVSDDPALEDELVLMQMGMAELEATRQRAVQEMMQENSADKQLVEAFCLLTGERVFQSIADIKAHVPPLAERFKDQASKFVHTEIMKDGKAQVVFQRVAE